MDLLISIRRLYEYEDWASTRIIDCLESMDNPPQLALGQLGHCLAARLAWLTRLAEGHSDDVEIWPLLDPASLRELHRATFSGITALIEGLTEEQLSETISYRSYEGTRHTGSLSDILFHMANHASQHRGVILKAIREAGGEPPACDWIIFTRG